MVKTVKMIGEQLKNVQKDIPEGVTLVAVSKTKPVPDLQKAYDEGQRIFGENKIQEMVDKYEQLPKDIEWHMIGHLQRNKVKYMAHFVDLIHGVDSFKTIQEIDKQAKKHNRVIDCLLQANIAKEDTKFGLAFESIKEILESDKLAALNNVNVVGLMGMATFTDDKKQLTLEFTSLKTFFNELQVDFDLRILSMGMSSDYNLAITCGSSMIRIGSAIFGKRNSVI